MFHLRSTKFVHRWFASFSPSTPKSLPNARPKITTRPNQKTIPSEFIISKSRNTSKSENIPPPNQLDQVIAEKLQKIDEDIARKKYDLDTVSFTLGTNASIGTQCSGCGAELQSTNPKGVGFVSNRRLDSVKVPSYVEEDPFFKSIIDYKAEKEGTGTLPVVCQRCWQLKHYGKVTPVEISREQLISMLKPMKEKRALMVKIVDIFDFDGSFLPNVRDFVGNNPIIVVANKADLLPSGATTERIIKWIRSCIKQRGLTNVVDVRLISSKTGFGIRDLANSIEERRQGFDVYVMGQTNVGKSTFINKLLQIFSGTEMITSLTMSKVPGTTLNTIGFPIGETGSLYDTPGVMKSKSGLENILTYPEYSSLIPNKRIKPVVLRIPPKTSFFLGGLARIDYISGPPLLYFTINTASNLYIHKCNLSTALSTYTTHVGTLLTPPNRQPEGGCIIDIWLPTHLKPLKFHTPLFSALHLSFLSIPLFLFSSSVVFYLN
eukprot:TRINITY_DN5890_c0_g2_i5.p1 TRINITY_DN5890_c0_g2~~TRINITY_DN5890_c0_g2_i5.p1  ORF type:complete len:491 (-),score=82.70 TRINITY_DN5890_c0_g2_i5:999-2471(-)